MNAPDGVLLVAVAVIIAALAIVAVVALMRAEDTQNREPGSQLDEWDRPKSTTDDGGWLP